MCVSSSVSLVDIAEAAGDLLAGIIAACVWLVLVLPFEAARACFCGCRRPRPRPMSIALTGATSGIGEALALTFAAPGVHLALSGRNAAALDTVSAACRARGATVLASACDVTDRPAVEAWLLAADAAAAVDLVIACAGVTEGTAKFRGTEQLDGAARALFATNVDGVFNTIFPLLPRMRERRRGHIALLSSLAGNGGLVSAPAYAATKAAVRVYGEALRAVVHRDGVVVTVIQPGYVAGPMTAGNEFPMPGLITMAAAVRAITAGLARGAPTVAFPAHMAIGTRLLGGLHWVVRDCCARHRLVGAIAYLPQPRGAGRRGGGGPGGVGTSAAPDRAEPLRGAAAGDA